MDKFFKIIKAIVVVAAVLIKVSVVFVEVTIAVAFACTFGLFQLLA